MRNAQRLVSALGVSALLAAPAARATSYLLGVGGGARYFQYAEAVPAPSKSTQYGTIPDIRGYAEQFSDDRAWFAREKIEYAWGILTYNGSTEPPNPVPVLSRDNHSFWVFEGTLGRDVGKLSRFETYLYAGLSYRIWNRDLANPREVYNLISVPIGLRFIPLRKEGFFVGIDLSARPLIYGRVHVSYASNYDSQTIPDAMALGFRAEFPVHLLGGKKFGLVLTPWFEYSGISQGDLVPLTAGGQPVTQNGNAEASYEPTSHTYQYGLSAAVEMAF